MNDEAEKGGRSGVAELDQKSTQVNGEGDADVKSGGVRSVKGRNGLGSSSTQSVSTDI